MDFLHFLKLYRSKKDPEMSERAFILSVYRRVLDGTYYDILSMSYSAGTAGAGNAAVNILEPDKYHFNQTVGMSQRRPSVRSALCSLVVDDAVSFVFDETHFPRISSDDKELEQILKDIVESSGLNLAMIQSARDGSVGSAALLVQLINGRFYFESLLTEFCTPVFNPQSPNELLSIAEQYKVRGSELIAKGYTDVDESKEYYFRREWTLTHEIVYKPWISSNSIKMSAPNWEQMTYIAFKNGVASGKVDQNGKPILDDAATSLEIDYERSCEHNLGFVPIVWTKNLPGNIYGVQGSAIDGACTFARAIDTTTELDYQLSQCGRGLKYSAEPILFIKDPSSLSQSGTIDKSNGGVIVGDENSDAKMVEINGDGCKAVLEYAQMLREIALENIHGNRSSPKQSGFQQSGKAMEMYNHPLILLAGLLRISYGEGLLKPILYIISKMIKQQDVIVNNKLVKANFNEYATISLIWPQWFDPSIQDEQLLTTNVIAAKDAGLITHKTAVSNIADQFGVLNINDELAEIEIEQAQFEELQPTIQEIIKA